MDHDELVELIRAAHRLQFDQVLFSAGQVAMTRLPPLRRLGLCHIFGLDESRIRQEATELVEMARRKTEKRERDQSRIDSALTLGINHESGTPKLTPTSARVADAGILGPVQKPEPKTLLSRERLLGDKAWTVAAFVDVVLNFDIQPPFRDADGLIDDSIRWQIMSARYQISAACAAQCMEKNITYTRSTYCRYNPHDIAIIVSTLPYVTRSKFQVEVALRFQRQPEPPQLATGGLIRVGQSQGELESWIGSAGAEEAAVIAAWVLCNLPAVYRLTV